MSTRLVTRILENLQIYIDNVHVRLEDLQHSFSAGITLKSAAATPQQQEVMGTTYKVRKNSNFREPMLITRSTASHFERNWSILE